MDAEVLTRMLGDNPQEISAIGGGGNSRVWKVAVTSGKKYFVKEYYRLCEDWQKRMDSEFEAFSLLREHGIYCVPEPLSKDFESGTAAYSFESGQKVKVVDISPAALDHFIAFSESLFNISKKKVLRDFKVAKAHCLKHDSLEVQLERRIGVLNKLESDEDCLVAEMNNFMKSEFVPLYQEIVLWRRDELKKVGVEGYSLKQGEWTLSPSDFGLHNALMQDDGSFIFLDFEYFGRDDPAKMVCDFMLHPAMNLSSEYLSRVYDGFDKVFGCEGYRVRLRTLLPLVGLKWCTIFLNEFLPHGMARRVHAAGKNIDSQIVKRRQLDKSLKQFQFIKDGYEDYLDVIIKN